ncbi:MAG: tRNA (adenosine(37)-N6)-threonylcarbamoyltransferase complex transferase subunit TsaD [Candidatus Cloacimonadota bacterium]|nr:tRNA (adenosine(37)-N6)-threonylcarbamoyltransferase complex transferase subunit TsaD [Candidatus Cloacimonadota bacterium]
MSLILAIETSCDDTSAAIVDTDFQILSNIISSQSIHEKFGGIVPELASREHIKGVVYVVDLALKKAGKNLEQIDAIAVSVNPGLIGSLLVGVSFAKGLAFSLVKPLIAINHIMGHVFANFLENPNIQFPFLSLVVSGGHTELVKFDSPTEFEVLGRTVDDAAGEAFDKIGKLLGFPYPGGPAIDKLAKKGNKNAIDFPLPMINKPNFNFSFSGLKTSASLYMKKNNIKANSNSIQDFCASYQNAIVEVLFRKTMNAVKKYSLKNILLSGGVAANSALRDKFRKSSASENIKIYFPSPLLCTDNAAMIGAAAVFKFQRNDFAKFSLNASSLKGIRKI